ncbi:hypothetical protein I3843_16G001900 [Carya illinoinensis]|uniref:GRAM domain-containing protein n=2 Tax=Carya illinoinensis TaxID=32201 RepID=A0A922A5D3_CARIL|nr:GEM-like protein 4 [Carya illinoinensis]KAG2662865.1 hypothetical protein I3760_16G002000 [Carya illinoinensis]KAG6671387.1 hypothetical protein I3842_16G002100 [Carya illinoinensis]KAG7940722.1 hypothetical protein I3843_16G001900 [Carya illinoinensis]
MNKRKEALRDKSYLEPNMGRMKSNAKAHPAEIPAQGYSPQQGKIDSVLKRMKKLKKKAKNFTHGVLEHVRLGHKFTEIMKWKLRLGAKILRVGGFEKVFKELFSVSEGEKLLKAFQCFLSTTAGPVAGLLFISTKKVSFCSERSIKVTSPNGEMVRFHYKVLIPLKKIKRVDLTENSRKPSAKYIEVTTWDNFDFWFMGFLNYQKSFKYLELAVSQARGN